MSKKQKVISEVKNMFRKTIIIRGLVLLLVIGVLSSLSWAGVKKLKEEPKIPKLPQTNSTATVQEKQKYQEIIDQYDQYGEKEILGWILRYPVFLDIVGAEISLSENQKISLMQIVKEEDEILNSLRQIRGMGAEEYNKQYKIILKSTDEKIRSLLSPLQYAKFRDWVIEEWILETNQAYRIDYRNTGIPPKFIPVAPVNKYFDKFLKNSPFNLSKEEDRLIKQLNYQIKEEILSLRDNFVQLSSDVHLPMTKIQEEGKKVVKQIDLKIQRLENDLKKKLPSDKYKLYKSYLENAKERK